MKKVIKNPFERFTQKGAAYVLWMCLLLAGGFTSCTTIGDITSQGVYFVVGFDGTSQVDEEKGTAKSGGYMFISECLKDSLLTTSRIWKKDCDYDDLLDGIIDFPIESMTVGYCGWNFFPEEYRFAFKVQINSYRQMTEEEEMCTYAMTDTFCLPCLQCRFFKKIIITSISKIQISHEKR